MTDPSGHPPTPPVTDAAPGPAPIDSPPPPSDSAPRVSRRVGQLTFGWQVMVTAGWAAAFFAFAGVWKASEEIGIATWWLGPRADPQPNIVRIIPFAIAILVALWAIYNAVGFPWVSLAGTAGMALIAVFDVSRSVGLALAELAIACSLLLVSLASFGGRYRRPPDPAEPSDGAAQDDRATPGDTTGSDPEPAPPVLPSPTEPTG